MQNTLTISDHLRSAIHIAQAFAKENKNERIGVSHMLRALMHKESGLHDFLKSLGKDPGYIAEWAEVRIDEYPKTNLMSDVPTADEQLSKVMEDADNVGLKLGLDFTDPICVLVALVKPNAAYSLSQLKSLPLREHEIVEHYLNHNKIKNVFKPSDSSEHVDTKEQSNISGALFNYCIEKNSQVTQGKTDPVIGREKEIVMMVEILGRRSKPNVLLIGEPGVGKSALVDGFVSKIIANEVPSILKSAIVFELELGKLLAGASYKGEVEDRLKNVLKEIKKFDKAILFIDELHTLLDSKGAVGSGIANMLKPELARGELTIIAASTQEEYRKVIEPDAAFNRRFETLTVNEPDFFTATKMLQQLLPKYETHHGIKVNPDVIADTINLSKRYIKDKRLPDAAIDLLDRTMAAIKMMKETSLIEVESVEKQFAEVFSDTALGTEEKLNEYKWIYAVLLNKLSPVLVGQLEEVNTIDEMETEKELYTALQQIILKFKEVYAKAKDEITREDVAAIIAHKTGIPVGKIQTQERDKLLNIEEQLKQRVVGQDHAIKILSDAIVESRSGIIKQGQPIGSFFFLGPTGTGKTELTKAIAEFLFNDEKAMIRFDMSEFKEEHSAALLYGAPPGYVGYEEGGMLVNKIRKQPYSVVLFDEIEKAHSSVFDTFLQIMDEGVLHDKLGKEGDFSNAIIIFTSNIGSEWIAEQIQKGLLPTSQQLMDVMAKNFRPEFLARLSEIIPFAPISEENAVRILEIQMQALLKSLTKLDIQLTLNADAKKILALTGFTPKYGARQLATVIRNSLRRKIARMIVAGDLKKGDHLIIEKENDQKELTWKIERDGKMITYQS
ncbi:MAG TPA: ATP-dependent Clp protease ATP-binding subunit [Bacteroidia bacterium]|nr:ATP-dependent Clp protease ATP-binding subunit [Bacteroidia bacterium]